MLIFSHTVHNVTQFLCTLKKLNAIFLATFNTKICNRRYNCYGKSDTIFKNNPRNVLFFGTDDFSLESLKVLYSKYESKVLQRLEVVSTIQRKENPVIKYARQKKIVINKWPVEINKSEFDIGIVVSFGHLIPSRIINAFPLGMINIHASLLPRWRGSTPIIHTLMNGDSQTGITIMKIMPKKFDIGDIMLQKQIDINEHETMPELRIKLATLGANLLGEVLENLSELLQSAKPQNKTNVTYAPKVTSKMSLVNWNEMSAENVYNLYRALLGLYSLTTSLQGVKIKLFDIQKIESESAAKYLEGQLPGTLIYNKNSNALIVKCKEESFISVKKIIVQNKHSISALDFSNGYISGKKKKYISFS